MNTRFYFRNFALLATLLFGAILAACSDDKTQSQVTLHYASISDIGPSMHFTSNPPSYKGATPSEFKVEGVKLNGELFNDADGCFSADASTGAIVIANTASLVTGTYSLSVSCLAGGQHSFFPDIVSVTMLAATPTAVEVQPNVLEIAYADAKTSKLTAQVTPLDEAVTVGTYALVQEEGKEYFTVSKTGVIGINAAFKDEILPGVYTPGLKLTSLAGAATYENTLTIKITSQPLEVTYKPALGRSEYNMAFASATPTVKGSTEGGLQWAISAVEPQTDKFTIDPATGVVSLPVDNKLPVDGVYTLDLAVSNQYGSADFVAAYSVKVVAFITQIDPAKFAYDAVEAIQGAAFDLPRKSGFVGDEVTFELGTPLPAALVGQIAIDDQTGKISAKKGNTIAIGQYDIPVKVSNTKGEATATARLTVKENPYYFTTISYGNNLSLSPASAYASQFSYLTANDLVAASGLTPTTDAKPGTELTWSVKLTWKMKSTTIDASTGALTFVSGSFDTAAKNGLLIVTATAGKGEVGETSVSIPVFFVLTEGKDAKGIAITSKPIVVQVNPKKGGKADVGLNVTGVSDMSGFLIDYRRTFQYFNVNGPASHVNGTPGKGNGTFMTALCEKYAQDVNAPSVPYGAKDMLSYYINRDKSALSAAIAYIEPGTLKLVINPDKWRNDDGYANGCFFGDMTYVTNGVESDVSGSALTTRAVWIWFDEKF